jgi:hypothetical protein
MFKTHVRTDIHAPVTPFMVLDKLEGPMLRMSVAAVDNVQSHTAIMYDFAPHQSLLLFNRAFGMRLKRARFPAMHVFSAFAPAPRAHDSAHFDAHMPQQARAILPRICPHPPGGADDDDEARESACMTDDYTLQLLSSVGPTMYWRAIMHEPPAGDDDAAAAPAGIVALEGWYMTVSEAAPGGTDGMPDTLAAGSVAVRRLPTPSVVFGPNAAKEPERAAARQAAAAQAADEQRIAEAAQAGRLVLQSDDGKRNAAYIACVVAARDIAARYLADTAAAARAQALGQNSTGGVVDATDALSAAMRAVQLDGGGGGGNSKAESVDEVD